MNLEEYIADAERMQTEAREQGYLGASKIWREVAKALRGVRDGGSWEDWSAVVEALRARPEPPKKPAKIVAVLSGGDWADASVEHIVLPEGITMEEVHAQYRAWYVGTYVPACKRGQQLGLIYMTLPAFAVERCGARYATKDELEEYESED